MLTRRNGFEVAAPDTNSMSLLTEFLQERRSRGLNPGTCQFYAGYLTKFPSGIEQLASFVTKHVVSRFLDSLTCSPEGNMPTSGP